MTDPQLSVVMPVFNAARYLSDAVESILSQTFSDFEFLIFDDGSTDQSLEILYRYAAIDERLRIVQGQHKGYAHWLNQGIRTARGEFVARMDADDISLPERLLEQVEYMQDHPECVAVGCDVLVIDENGQDLGVDQHESCPELMEKLLLNGTHGVIAHPTSLMRRRAVLEVGLYREEYECIEDFDLWMRLSEIGKLGNVCRSLFKYRIHPSSVCSSKFRIQQRHADTIIREARLKRGLKPLQRSVWPTIHRTDDEAARLQLWSGCFLSLGQKTMALRYAYASIRRRPFAASSWLALSRIVIPRTIKTIVKNLLVDREYSKHVHETQTLSMQ